MKNNIIYLIALLSFIFINHQTRSSYKRSWKANLSRTTKKSFTSKENFYIYRSLLTGRKRGVPKGLVSKMKDLNLLHLLTPSGLHYSSIFFIFLLIQRKKKNKVLQISELAIAMSIYIFLPGYYSFRRIALLRTLFISKDLLNIKVNSILVFIIFLFVDVLFGTFNKSTFSFIFSCAFISLFMGNKKQSTSKILVSIFFMQMIIAYAFDSNIYLASAVVSPLITYLFTFLFPLLCFNFPFAEILNYSEILINFFSFTIKLSHTVVTYFKAIEVNIIMILGILVSSRKRVFLSLGLFVLGLLN